MAAWEMRWLGQGRLSRVLTRSRPCGVVRSGVRSRPPRSLRTPLTGPALLPPSPSPPQRPSLLGAVHRRFRGASPLRPTLTGQRTPPPSSFGSVTPDPTAPHPWVLSDRSRGKGIFNGTPVHVLMTATLVASAAVLGSRAVYVAAFQGLDRCHAQGGPRPDAHCRRGLCRCT